MDVPYDALAPDALRGLIEEFVTRAGTDYGVREKTLEEKMADVYRQLARGDAIIIFDPDTGTTTVVPAPGTSRPHAQRPRR